MDQSTAPTAQKDETPRRPNIILVCVDEMRADAFGAAGNEHIDTPNLDELARRGYRFTRAYSATPTCVPARVVPGVGIVRLRITLRRAAHSGERSSWRRCSLRAPPRGIPAGTRVLNDQLRDCRLPRDGGR